MEKMGEYKDYTVDKAIRRQRRQRETANYTADKAKEAKDKTAQKVGEYKDYTVDKAKRGEGLHGGKGY
ncbi:hypothetical protein YC2023_047266 [Brassica napus]